MIEILAGTLIGIVLGTLSGIVPGVHANTLAGILISLQAPLLILLGPGALACTLFSALITHTFVDAIPSTFLGIPDADTSLAVLPAHALCLEGNGEEAVRIAALGSACAMVIAVPLSIACIYLLPALQPYIDWWIGILLIGTVGWMLVTSDAPGWGLGIFIASGMLGLFALRFAFLGWHTLAGGNAILMPLLTGLFGISVLLTASRGTVPEQQFRGIRVDNQKIVRSSFLGTLAGIAVGWLPGLSTASANGVLASFMGYGKDRRAYLLATNAANTANAFIGLAALFALGRMRNGVIAAIAEISLPAMGDLMAAGVLAACAAYLFTIRLSRIAHQIGKIDNRVLNRLVIILMILLSILLTGPFGLLILILATAVGLVPRFINLPAVYCMGSIMFPVILWSFGLAWA
jgi:putative membrane protein